MMRTNYANTDFDLSSEAAHDLFARLDREAVQHVLGLTPLHGAEGLPAFFTNAMVSWYKYFVQGDRSRSLDEVQAQIGSEERRRGPRSFIYEIERDRIEAEKLSAIETEREAFLAKKEASDVYADLQDRLDQYNRMKLESGRDAQRSTPWLYWTVMLIFLIPEFLINWESFSKIPILQNTPALILGLVILVAAFFIFSSHRIGMMLKQRQDRFGGDVGATERRKSQWDIVLGLVLFALGMGIVVWGRYLLISDALQEKSILRGEGFGIDEMLTVGGALLGNVGAWVLGIVWSIVKHDSIPNFSELRSEMENLRSKMRKLYEKNLTSRIQRRMLEAQKRVDQLNKANAQTVRSQTLQQARAVFSILKQKDGEALALLEEYRSRLISAIKESDRDTIFVVDDITKADMIVRTDLSPDEFARLPLQLRYA